MRMQRKSPRLDSRRQSHCEDDGRERNGVYKSHFRFQGVFLCEFSKESRMVPRAGKKQERLLVKGRSILLRRWSPRENMIIPGKFRRGWLELKGLPFHL